jgi:RimJ/RimL family protein N-acetyltransferase
MSTTYVFKSERLGYRNWLASDLPKLCKINSDDEVMEFFPSKATSTQTEAFIHRMQEMYARVGFCYFAVDRLDTEEFIGFIGLSEQNYAAEFCPCIDIGWRIDPSHWNLGFATEGAQACLEFGQKQLRISEIFAVAPLVNIKSINIMEKIGMRAFLHFQHPALLDNSRLVKCACYRTI